MKIENKLNKLIGKPYNKITYHCWHFIEEVLDVPTLEDIHADSSLDDIEKYKLLFEEIESPIDFCIVLIGDNHVGIWYNGGIYHNDTLGVRYEAIRAISYRYRSFKYYKVNNDIYID